MTDALRKEEINSLLMAVESGKIKEDFYSEPTQKVKKHDFSRPNKLSKNHMTTLEIIHTNYGKILSNYLSSEIGINIEVRLEKIEQTIYEKFIKSVKVPTLFSVFTMSPLGEKFILETSPIFGFQMIEILCGGEVKSNQEIRKFTEIEIDIIKELLSKMIEKMEAAWKDVQDVKPNFEKIEPNPKSNDIMYLNQSIIQIGFIININGLESTMNICIPYEGLNNIIDKLYENSLLKNESFKNQEGSWRETIEKNITDSNLNLNIILGKAKITVKEFLELSKGDVLGLNQSVNTPLKMLIEDQLYSYVQPGKYDDKLGVQVINIVEKEVNDNEE